MTRLTGQVRRSIVTREGTHLVVILSQAGISFREKGRRVEYGPIPYGRVFLDAVSMHVARPQLRPRRVVRGAL